jgi:Arc/MetJ-type ribon-helix-helix transcriptional regulator
MTEDRNPGISVRVAFNQQQRQLIDRLRETGQVGTTDAEVVRNGFVRWLESEGWITAVDRKSAGGR